MFYTSYQVSPTINGDPSQLLAVAATVTESSSTVNDLRLVFNGDILLLALFSCLVLLGLRRAFARFSCTHECIQGHILWSTSADKWRNRLPSADIASQKGVHIQHPHTYLEDRLSAAAPPHAPVISSIIHPIASPFAHRITPGFSLGQVVILGVYGAILQYESFYKSNLFTDPIRTGFVGTAQIPFLFALATKNNILASLVGLSYEKVIIRHCHQGPSDLIYVGQLHSSVFGKSRHNSSRYSFPRIW
jgi:hypothetical protein